MHSHAGGAQILSGVAKPHSPPPQYPQRYSPTVLLALPLALIRETNHVSGSNRKGEAWGARGHICGTTDKAQEDPSTR